MDKKRIANVTTRSFKAIEIDDNVYVQGEFGVWTDNKYNEEVDSTVACMLDAIVELDDLLKGKEDWTATAKR